MIWIIIALHIIALVLGILLHIAKRSQKTEHNRAQEQPPYKPLEPEWNRPKPPPPPTQLEIACATIPQQREFKPLPQIIQPTASQIRSLASQYAAEGNIEIGMTTWIWNQVINAGGLKPYRNDRELEEFKENVPKHFRRKAGTTPDQMADMLGYENDQELYEAIQTEVRNRRSLTAHLPNKRYTSKHFMEDAREDLVCQLNPHLQ